MCKTEIVKRMEIWYSIYNRIQQTKFQQTIGMGKSQRYQAAVDGHYAAVNHWIISEKIHGTKASRAGIRADSFNPAGSWGYLRLGVILSNPPVWGIFLLPKVLRICLQMGVSLPVNPLAPVLRAERSGRK